MYLALNYCKLNKNNIINFGSFDNYYVYFKEISKKMYEISQFDSYKL
jgi:hypothetical protein